MNRNESNSKNIDSIEEHTRKTERKIIIIWSITLIIIILSIINVFYPFISDYIDSYFINGNGEIDYNKKTYSLVSFMIWYVPFCFMIFKK